MPSAYDLMPVDTECSTQSANQFGLYECRFESTGLGAFGKAIGAEKYNLFCTRNKI